MERNRGQLCSYVGGSTISKPKESRLTFDLPPLLGMPPMIWHVLCRHIRSSLLSLCLQGYQGLHTSILFMVPALFKVLGQSCPHLQHLSLHIGNLVFIPMASLPLTLSRLEMQGFDSSLI